MDSNFWLARWQDNKIGFHQQEFNQHLVSFWHELGVDSGNTVFVPLCGKSQDLLWLYQQGYCVIGIEFSELAVKAYFEENKLPFSRSSLVQAEDQSASPISIWKSETTTLLCGDFFALKPTDLGSVHAVYDRAALIALPTEMRQRYVQHFKSLFENDLRVLLVTLEYPQEEMQGPPFSVEESEVLDLYSQFLNVNKVYERDILHIEENARFLAAGMTKLVEKVYLLTSSRQ